MFLFSCNTPMWCPFNVFHENRDYLFSGLLTELTAKQDSCQELLHGTLIFEVFRAFRQSSLSSNTVQVSSETFAEKFGTWKGGIFDIGYFFLKQK